ncbi:MAG: hypothetical protein Q4A01_02485 [Coriobacteriales bacterium]|nr:hypothetical protein [Coriobacteriales bacterium]
MMVAGNRGFMPVETRSQAGRTGSAIRRIPLVASGRAGGASARLGGLFLLVLREIVAIQRRVFSRQLVFFHNLYFHWQLGILYSCQ